MLLVKNDWLDGIGPLPALGTVDPVPLHRVLLIPPDILGPTLTAGVNPVWLHIGGDNKGGWYGEHLSPLVLW